MPSPTFSFLNIDFSFSELLSLFKIPSASPSTFNLAQNWHQIPYSYCKKHLILPLLYEHNGCKVAMTNPFDFEVEKELAFMLNGSIEILYCPKEDLELWIDHYFHKENEKATQLFENLQDKTNDNSTYACYDLLDPHEQSAPSVRLLNFIIQEGITQKASDIHFEPVDNSLRIRYRIDGVLQNRHQIPEQHQAHIISRLKVMAQLDIAETRRPQDGRIKLKLGQREVDFRASTIPISSGERIVLRILDRENSNLNLLDLKMNPGILTEFQEMIRRSEGILLVTGPTGSGKTTTLYSAISDIYQESLNIMTIEDPIEYKLPHIAQMGVHPKIGLTFATGLRHILRQDPDVILIGEIRDLETAQIAIQASLTGHLVLSTLHTNDAPSAITRLVDMGIEPYLLSSSIIGILAQRLLRLICTHCKQIDHPPSQDLERLHLDLDPHMTFYKGVGCPECHFTGYKGRQGIYELMPVKGEVKKNISISADSNHLRKLALDDGLITLKKQGGDLIAKGLTTVEEVLRIALGVQES